jgi:hypothetical protein
MKKLKALFEEYSQISLRQMGFPSDWEENTIWQD